MTIAANHVVSCDAMTYLGTMHHRFRHSDAYRFGYALGSTAVRLITWPFAWALGHDV